MSSFPNRQILIILLIYFFVFTSNTVAAINISWKLCLFGGYVCMSSWLPC